MDIITDQNPVALYEVGLRAGDNLPIYIKEASMLQAEDVSQLSDNAFADRINRLHPIHTKEAAYMSAVYLAGNNMTDTVEFETVKQACVFFDIYKDVEAAIDLIKDKTETSSKEAAAQDLCSDDFALKFNITEAETLEAYPIGNAFEVTKSASDLIRDWKDQHIPTDWVYAAAKNIVKKANAFNLNRNELSDRIWNMGEERLPDMEYATGIAEQRDRKFSPVNKEYSQTISKIASEDDIESAIDTWMTLDTVYGVNHLIETPPQEAFYSGPRVAEVEKLAHANVLINGVLIPSYAFNALSRDNYVSVKQRFNKEASTLIENSIETLSKGKLSSDTVTSVVAKELEKLSSTQQKELISLLVDTAS